MIHCATLGPPVASTDREQAATALIPAHLQISSKKAQVQFSTTVTNFKQDVLQIAAFKKTNFSCSCWQKICIHTKAGHALLRVEIKYCTTGVHKPCGTKFCMVTPNICKSSVWSLDHVTILALTILRWLNRFLENLLTSDLPINNKFFWDSLDHWN